MVKSRFRVVIGILAIIGGIGVVAAQTPAFDVVSIKPNKSGGRGSSGTGTQPSGRWAVSNVTLFQLITNAYRLRDSQVVGGPGWIKSDRYDIEAKAEGNPTPDRRPLMIQSLLADRFSLRMHHETRELTLFTLVAARSDKKPGPRLRVGSAADADCNARVDLDLASASGDLFKAVPPCGEVLGQGPMGGTRMGLRGTTMDVFAVRLARSLGGNPSVVNETGLEGVFNVDLEWTANPSSTTSADGTAPAEALSLFTALQEQLGLKLVSSKGPVDVVVIDSVDHPREN